MSSPTRRRTLLAALLALLLSSTTGCITRPATPDPEQIAVGLEAALPEYEPGAAPAAAERLRIALVIPSGVAEAEPVVKSTTNWFWGTGYRVEMNPDLLVLESMAAYLGTRGTVKVVPEASVAPADSDLVLGATVESLEWRTNWWRNFLAAQRIEARIDLILVDHARSREQALSSGWTLGGVFYSSHPTGVANRVVRAVAHATAKTLAEAGVPSRP